MKKYMQKRGKKDLNRWGNGAVNKKFRDNQQISEIWLKKQGKQAQKSAKKWPQKMPKNAENWGERGQPTKR